MPSLEKNHPIVEVEPSDGTATILEFPNPLRHRTEPCPTKPDRTLWQHGEPIPGTQQIYCRVLDIFCNGHGNDPDRRAWCDARTAKNIPDKRTRKVRR